jgi:hypothetical protein
MIFLTAAALAVEAAPMERQEIDQPAFRQTLIVISIKEPRGGELQIGCTKNVKETFRIQFFPRGKIGWWEKYLRKHLREGNKTWLGYNFANDQLETGNGFYFQNAFLLERLLKNSAMKASFLDRLTKESYLHFQYGDPVGRTYTANFNYVPDKKAIKEIVEQCQPRKVTQSLRDLGWQFEPTAK